MGRQDKPKTAKQREAEGLVECWVIHPRSEGGLMNEDIPKADVPADAVQFTLFDKTLPLLVKKYGMYDSFNLPDAVYFSPQAVADIPGCIPWKELSALTRRLWDDLKWWMAPAAAFLLTIAYVIATG